MKLTRQHFEQLALEQLDMLYRVARRLTRSPAAAEDLVQDTYLRAIRFSDGFDLQEYGIRPWLVRIMQNIHTSQAERESRQPTAVETAQLETSAPTQGNGGAPPIDFASFDAMDEQLVHALEDLPQEYRTVMMLWAVEDFSYKEIADALEVPIGTVMSRLHRGRQRLAEQLRDYAKTQGIIREYPQPPAG